MNEDETQVEGAPVGDDPESQRTTVGQDPPILMREPGKSLLPFSRVQKIIKADKDIPVVAKEAVFLISLATEEFIKRIAEDAQRVATREKRMIVQHKDLATVVRKVDEFAFLEELIPWMSAEVMARRKPRPVDKKVQENVPSTTLLDQFLAGKMAQGGTEAASSDEANVNASETHKTSP